MLGEVLPLPGLVLPDASPNTPQPGLRLGLGFGYSPQRAAAEARAAAAAARGTPSGSTGAAANRFGTPPKAGGQVRRRQTLGGAGTVSKQF